MSARLRTAAAFRGSTSLCSSLFPRTDYRVTRPVVNNELDSLRHPDRGSGSFAYHVDPFRDDGFMADATASLHLPQATGTPSLPRPESGRSHIRRCWAGKFSNSPDKRSLQKFLMGFL
jgi:hypothetical protein